MQIKFAYGGGGGEVKEMHIFIKKDGVSESFCLELYLITENK